MCLHADHQIAFAPRQVLRIVEAKRVVTLRFWLVRILPIGLFMALTLHFGNLVYLYLTVAFIQMLKVRGLQLKAHAGVELHFGNRIYPATHSQMLIHTMLKVRGRPLRQLFMRKWRVLSPVREAPIAVVALWVDIR